MKTKPPTNKQKRAKQNAAARGKLVSKACDGICEVLMTAGLTNAEAIAAQLTAVSLTMNGLIAACTKPKTRAGMRASFVAGLQHTMLNLAAPRKH